MLGFWHFFLRGVKASFLVCALGICHVSQPPDKSIAHMKPRSALTGATQMGNAYELTVGNTRFHVRYRFVRRLRDVTDPQGAYEETCFYPAKKEMPKSEHIATALLQLRNNPALFDRWAAQSGAFKADGQAFRPRALIHFR